LLTFISLVYGILIFGLPMLFVHWNSFVLAFGAIEKDSIFGDLGGNKKSVEETASPEHAPNLQD
jgi:hypothetical protein